ncbi:MAG: hypothetical protein LUE99_09755 [Bacteroides sp.]|nr:hypothetical protein [Bacteroides sp.]
MLSLFTLKAIAALHDLVGHGNTLQENYATTDEEIAKLCHLFECKGLVTRLLDRADGVLSSYRLSRSICSISLLDVLEATGEHLNCNRPTSEEFYMHNGLMARKLGVVNHMTRLYLEEIKLTEC